MIGVGVLDLGYLHVDVFSRRAFQGNGLVVVLDAENLSTAVMQELTREVRQFETAFLAGVDLPGRSARLRIFTEDEELDFAGHPVLGAFDPSPEAEVDRLLQLVCAVSSEEHHGRMRFRHSCALIPIDDALLVDRGSAAA